MSPLFVRGMGMACPLGLTAASAGAAIRGGLERKQELPFADSAGEPLIGSFHAGWPFVGPIWRRWVRYLAFAIRDALRDVPATTVAGLPLLCALPTHGNPRNVAPEVFVARLMEELGDWPAPPRVQVVTTGAQGAYGLLAEARTMLAQGYHPGVLVCAADCLVGAGSLLRLQQGDHLLTSLNTDGVIPGEAAACVWVTSEPRDAVARVLGLGFGREPSSMDNDIPLRADGAVSAGRQALREAGLEMHEMDIRASDAAGEGYHFKEQALTIQRLLRRKKERFPLRLVAKALGDTGAAAGLCNMVSIMDEHDFEPEFQRVIAWAAGDDGERAAVVFQMVRA